MRTEDCNCNKQTKTNNQANPHQVLPNRGLPHTHPKTECIDRTMPTPQCLDAAGETLPEDMAAQLAADGRPQVGGSVSVGVGVGNGRRWL